MKRWLILLVLFFPLWAFAEDAFPLPAQDDVTGKWGYRDAESHWAIDPVFDEAAPFHMGFACVSKDASRHPYHHDGIIDRNGCYVVPPDYYIYNDNGDDDALSDLYIVSTVGSDGLSGFFDVKSGIFSGLKWHEVLGRMACDHLVPVLDENGHAGYASRETGEIAIPCMYAGVYPGVFSEGVAVALWADITPEQTEDAFLINETGAIIPLPPGITAVYGASAQCGRILIQDKETEQYGYADLEGHVVIEPVFSYADDFENGIARAEKDGIFVLIDLSGNLITK